MISQSDQQKSKELTDHFFRHEYSKMVAVITRYFGVGQVDLAEDIVQDTLLEAIKSWEYKGIPYNPRAWLYTVAKNKALNTLKRDKYKKRYEKETKQNFVEPVLDVSIDHLFSEQKIADDQLRMMFVCCHPSLSQDSQIALILKTLCGLSIAEIAKAFIASNETVKKRLTRARKILRDNQIRFEIPDNGGELESRVDTVLKTIYLLFNEGYKASKGSKLIRYELCLEAIRLGELIRNNPLLQDKSEVNALLALMLLNASRFEARQDEKGNIIEMAKQDRSLWNQPLINKGLFYLQHIQESPQISIYHILATISAHHCTAPNDESTDWPGILALYEGLVTMDNSPLVLLNRAIALSKVDGSAKAITELVTLESVPALKNYHLLYSTLAELYIEQQEYEKAIKNLTKALKLIPMDSEIKLLITKLEHCKEQLK